MRLALFTGMRRGELLKLQWDDIDTERGFIKIRDPKGGPDQTIPLNTAAREVFHVILKNGDSPYVFPGKKKDEHLKDMRKSIARIKTNAGLPDGFRPLHGLRHVYASMLASSGKVDMYTLQKLLTHKSPQMTQRYAHLRDEALKRASELAGDIVSQASKQKSDDKVVNLDDHKY
jgi:integrase